MFRMIGRTAAALWRPTARAMRWRVFLAASVAGLAPAGLPGALSVDLGPDDLTPLLRLSAVCTGVGLAFLFDDPAAGTVSTVPTPRLVRQAVRAGLALAAAAAGWLAAVAVITLTAEPQTAAALPWRALTLEAGAVFAAATALAAVAARRGTASVVAAPGLLVLAAVAFLLPARAALLVPPSDAGWAAAHDRWALLLGAAAVLAGWAGGEPRPRRFGRRAAPVRGRHAG